MARHLDHMVKHIVLVAVVLVGLFNVASALNTGGRHGGRLSRRRRHEAAVHQDRTESLAKHDRGGKSTNDTAYLFNFSSPPTLLNTNLGGLGPNNTNNFRSLAFGDVAKIKNKDRETSVSLVFYNTTFYDPRSAVEINGITETWYPTISVYAGTNVTLRGVLVNSETGKKVKLSTFVLSVINLDAWFDGAGCQQIIAKDFVKYKSSGSGSSVKIEKMEDGRTSFMATFMSDNHLTPSSPLLMEPSIFQGSIALYYENVDEIELTLQVKNLGHMTKDFTGLDHSRRYFFATIPTQVTNGEWGQTPNLSATESHSNIKDVFIPLFLFFLLLLCCCCLIFPLIIFEIRCGSCLWFGAPFKIFHGQDPNHRFHN